MKEFSLAYYRVFAVKGAVSRKIKIGVVGAGVFGGYHALKCYDNPNIEFVGIYDHNVKNAVTIAKQYDALNYNAYNSLLSDVEAVIIASPAQTHGSLAIAALKVGVHCLIEKPIAANLNDAQQIVELAKANNCIVQIGHQERFVAQAIGLDQITEIPLSITAFRMSPYSSRGTDVSVTLDLMSHDLDLLNVLVKVRASKITGAPVQVRSNMTDAALGILSFPSGTVARLHASRVEEVYRRTMDITYSSGTVSIDFNAKTLTHNTPFKLDADFKTNPFAQDSLGAATNAFVKAILDDSPVPITAEDGYKALEMALAIDGDIIWDAKDV